MFINIDFHICHIPGLDDYVHNKLQYHSGTHSTVTNPG